MRRMAGWLVPLTVALSFGCSTQNVSLPPEDAGVEDDLQACDVPPECVVVPESCCGSCGAATRDDAISVNRDFAGVYRTVVCEGEPGCPPCYDDPDPTLVATCLAGRCGVVDLQDHPLTECTDSEDCRLRTRDCCECGGDMTEAGLIAIRAGAAEEAEYVGLVCEPEATCPECEPIYPDEATAICSAGRCVVAWEYDGA
jgi:hypothetical protein